MRPFGLGCLILCMVSTLGAQVPELPKDHPPVPPASGRAAASDLTEQLRPSRAELASTPVARKNLIDEFIFGKLEKDGVPHASLSSDEEVFRRVQLDLTPRMPPDHTVPAL